MKKHAIALALGLAAILSGCNSAADTKKGGIEAQTLTVNSVNDLKGYTIVSNEASTSGPNGSGGTTYTITLSINCDGNSTYSDGHSPAANSGAVTLEDSGTNPPITVIKWSGANGGYLMLGTDHKLIAGKSCWLDQGLGGAGCSAGLYVKTIKHDTICQ